MRLCIYLYGSILLIFLNRFTKLYMFDSAFDRKDLMHVIGQIFNRSTTVKFIVATKDLTRYGFHVEEEKCLGSLQCRGANMSRTFYLYKAKQYMHFSRANPSTTVSSWYTTALVRNERYAAVLASISLYENAPRLRLVNYTF